jgi:hypothetical protein
MGGGERIRFSLPDTMSPQEWLLLMAQRRKIDGYRMGRYHYDAGGDINSVEYFPSTGIYEARSYWD